MPDPGEETLIRRPAREADLPFLFNLHRSTFREYVVQTWGDWNEVWQRERFENWLRLEERDVVLLDGTPIGSLGALDKGTHVVVEYIAVDPGHQNRGIGTRLVRQLLEEAHSRGVPLRLNVLKVNPARRLYERLGFRVVGGDSHRHFMEAAVPSPESN